MRQVAYGRVGEGLRAEWHRRIGQRLERGYGQQAPEIAVALATHFVRGQDTLRAARYLRILPDQALFSPTCQAAHPPPADAGLELLPTRPKLPQYAQPECTH